MKVKGKEKENEDCSVKVVGLKVVNPLNIVLNNKKANKTKRKKKEKKKRKKEKLFRG